MVEIPKRGGWGGTLFGKNSQIIPYFFSDAFPYAANIDCYKEAIPGYLKKTTYARDVKECEESNCDDVEPD